MSTTDEYLEKCERELRHLQRREKLAFGKKKAELTLQVREMEMKVSALRKLNEPHQHAVIIGMEVF